MGSEFLKNLQECAENEIVCRFDSIPVLIGYDLV